MLALLSAVFLLQRLGAALPSPDHIIIISRHGVRRQFPSSAFKFEEYAPGRTFQTSDEEWGAGHPGMDVLTQHGYDAVVKMGEAARHRYVDGGGEGTTSGGGDEAALGKPSTSRTGSLLCNYAAVYCEKGMARDEKTAEAFFRGLGCKATPSFHYEDADFIIDQGSTPRGDSGECTLLSEAETQGRVGGDLGANYANLAPYNHLLGKLNTLLGCCTPSLCDREGSQSFKELMQQAVAGGVESSSSSSSSTKTCGISDLGSHWDENHWYTTFEGPLYAGKYFGEWFLLNYLNGMDYAWGELSESEVLELAQFVTLYRSFEFDLPSARSFGSALLTHVAATLQLWAKSPPPLSPMPPSSPTAEGGQHEEFSTTLMAKGAVDHGPKARLVYYAAHDTNLLYLAELLGLKWLSRGGWQPNHTPPGGQLVFEVYNPSHPMNNPGGIGGSAGDGNGWTVALFFDTQTPKQIRNLTDLTFSDEASTPSRSAVTIPGCSSGPNLLCPVDTLVEIVRKAARPECIMPSKLRAFAKGSGVPDGGGSEAATPPSGDKEAASYKDVVAPTKPAVSAVSAPAAAASAAAAKPAAHHQDPAAAEAAAAQAAAEAIEKSKAPESTGTLILLFLIGGVASLGLNVFLFHKQRQLGEVQLAAVKYGRVVEMTDHVLDDDDVNDHIGPSRPLQGPERDLFD